MARKNEDSFSMILRGALVRKGFPIYRLTPLPVERAYGMAIVIVDCDTGLLVAPDGYTNDLTVARHFDTKEDAKQFCTKHSTKRTK